MIISMPPQCTFVSSPSKQAGSSPSLSSSHGRGRLNLTNLPHPHSSVITLTASASSFSLLSRQDYRSRAEQSKNATPPQVDTTLQVFSAEYACGVK
ncbi:hypothetical protein QQP08_021775 [Theobroma cacao]|nr:hypothetical protein QQP08_021775 [Theobroma cacao]